MKTSRILSMAALALLMAACSNETSELLPSQPEQPAEPQGIPFRATIGSKTDASTRALTETPDGMVAEWSVGEELGMTYDIDGYTFDAVATVTEVDADGVATIEATLEPEVTNGTPVTLVYPYQAYWDAGSSTNNDDLSHLLFDGEQDGTLNMINTKYDIRKSSGATLKVVGGTASLNGNVTLENMFCIFKLSLTDIGGNFSIPLVDLDVFDAENFLLASVRPNSDISEMYVVLPTTSTTLKFLGHTDAGKGYYNVFSGLSLEKKYYVSTLRLATVGDVILSNGRFASPGTDGAVAMVVTFNDGDNTLTGYYRGIAMALSDANGGNACAWSNDMTQLAGVQASSDYFGDHYFNATGLPVYMCGIDNTETLIAAYGNDYAAGKAKAYSVDGFDPTDYHFSNWFLPSSTQWLMFFFDACWLLFEDEWYDWGPAPGVGEDNFNAINNLLTAAGSTPLQSYYWTSSEYNEGSAVVVNFHSDGVEVGNIDKTAGSIAYVRPFIAF